MEINAETMNIMRDFAESLGMLMLFAAVIAVILNALNAHADKDTIARRNRLVPALVSLMCPLVIIIVRPHAYIAMMLVCIPVLILVNQRIMSGSRTQQ